MDRFLYNNEPRKEELETVLKNSNPPYLRNIQISKTEADFNLGKFSFIIKSFYKKQYKIRFNKNSMNDFWSFLETLIETKEALIFPLFESGIETFIFCLPANKTDIRFSIADTEELFKKEKEGKILKYSYAECNISVDCILNKREFIKSFYFALYEMFENYKNTALFEPPLIDFDFWIKDSNKIKRYLSKK